MNEDLQDKSTANAWRSMPRQKKTVAIGAVLVILSILFPPYARNLGREGTGEFEHFQFILSHDSKYEKIYWGMLFLEWLLIVGGIALYLYLTKPSTEGRD